MLREEGARTERHLDVGRMRKRTSDSDQLALALLIFARNVPGYVKHLVRGAFDIDTATAACQRALQPQEEITIFHRPAVAVRHTVQQLRRWMVATVQGLPQLIMVTLMAVVPDWLTHDIDL